MNSHYDSRQQVVNLQDEDWTESTLCNEEYEHLRLSFSAMAKEYESMWDGHLGRTIVARNSIVLNSTDAPTIQSAPCRAGSKQPELGRLEIEKMREAGTADHNETERVSLLEFVPKNVGG